MPRRFFLALIIAFMLGAGGLPARAAERVDALPALKPFKTMRDNFVATFNGRPLQVCQSEWESWNRVHGACRDLVTAAMPDQTLVAGALVEFVFYDGVHYQRADEETLWTVSRDEQYDPDLTFADALFRVKYDAVLTRIGDASVGGAPATHYQYWSVDKAFNQQNGGLAVYDLFLSLDNRVVSDVFSARGRIAGLGEGTLARTWVYSDFDAPITVAPPAADKVQAPSASSLSIPAPRLAVP